MADVPRSDALPVTAHGGTVRVPFTVKTAAAMAVLYVVLGILAETQAGDLAAALAWAIAAGVGLTFGTAAVAEIQGMIK